MARQENGSEIIAGVVGLIASCIGIFAFVTGFQSIWQIPFFVATSTPTSTSTLTPEPTETLTPFPTKYPTKTPNPILKSTPTNTLTGEICGNASVTIESEIIITVLANNVHSKYADFGISSDGKPMVKYQDVGLGDNMIYSINEFKLYEVRVTAFYEVWWSSQDCLQIRVSRYSK
jgi:hypothetical protein